MGELKMYLPNGEQCNTIDEFITCYNSQYYWMNKGHSVERRIDTLLYEQESYDSKIIYLILAWKMAGIDMKKSNDLINNTSKNIYYYKNKGWIENNLSGKNNGKLVDFSKIIKQSVELSSDRKKWMKKGFAEDKEGASELLTKLADTNTNEIGAVYYLTLLYFLTASRWPIYDQFVYKAMCAIEGGLEPYKARVDYSQRLPQKDKGKNYSKKLSPIVFENSSNQYRDYVDFIKDFEKELPKERRYTASRDIDRALWVYGHLF